MGSELATRLRERHIHSHAYPYVCWEGKEKCVDLQAADELDELKQLFDSIHAAEMRGIQLWREAHPGNELVQPSTDRLVEWLLGELERVRAAVYLEPCHVTGEHDPTHTPKYVCILQLRDVAKRVLQALDVDQATAPRRIHGEKCYWCHKSEDAVDFETWAARD